MGKINRTPLVLHYTNDASYGKFEIDFECVGKYARFLTGETLSKAKRLVQFLVQLLELDNIKCKFRKLRIRFEWGRSSKVEGLFLDKGDEGLLRVFCRTMSNERQFLETIAHELVHAKQYGFGELAWTFRRVAPGQAIGCFSWHDSYFDNDEDLEAYKNQPWEHEAYAFQSILVDAFEAFLKGCI